LTIPCGHLKPYIELGTFDYNRPFHSAFYTPQNQYHRRD
jgi:hypothetical protein